MSVLLVGANGSIGQRYKTILEMMGQRTRCVDLPRGASFETYYEFCKDPQVKEIIIASPTDTHLDWIEACCQAEKPFLCEKPLSKDLKSLVELQKNYQPTGYVVCNYTYIIQSPLKEIEYNFFKTGRDGLTWDMCQLIYLAYRYNGSLTVKTDSPFWTLSVDKVEIPYRKLEESYHSMLIDFFGQRKRLWPFAMGVEMTKVVGEIPEYEGSFRYSVQDSK